MTETILPDIARKNFLALKKRSYDIKFELESTNYEPIENIGTGAYGVVCSALHKKSKDKVAIKKIPHIFDHRKLAERTFREIKILKHFKHDNIICIREILKPSEPISNFKDVYIVLDLMESDLHRIIRSNQDLTDEHVRYFLYQILRGLKYIHSANVIHRDLKPSNLLVNENCDLKIGDFGMARGISSNPTDSGALLMTQYVATRWYRAPEMMLSVEYTAAIDVWSVGCIFAELLDRKPLFPGKDSANQLSLIIKKLGTPSEEVLNSSTFEPVKGLIKDVGYQEPKPFDKQFPSAARKAVKLLGQMLTFHPEERLSIDRALKHPYLSKYHDPDDEPICVPAFCFDFEKRLNEMNSEELKDAIVKEIMDYHKPKPKLTLSQFNIKPVSAASLQKNRSPTQKGKGDTENIMWPKNVTVVESKNKQNEKTETKTDQVVPKADDSDNRSQEPANLNVFKSLLSEYTSHDSIFKKPPEPLFTKVKHPSGPAKPGSAVSDVEMLSARSSCDSKPVTPNSVDMHSANIKQTDTNVAMLSAKSETKCEIDLVSCPDVGDTCSTVISQFEDKCSIPAVKEDKEVLPPGDTKEQLKAALQRRKERLEAGDVKPRITAYQRQKEREDKRKKKLEKLSEKRKKDKKKGNAPTGENLLLTEDDKNLLARWANMQQPAPSKDNKTEKTGQKMVSLLKNKTVMSNSMPLQQPKTVGNSTNMRLTKSHGDSTVKHATTAPNNVPAGNGSVLPGTAVLPQVQTSSDTVTQSHIGLPQMSGLSQNFVTLSSLYPQQFNSNLTQSNVVAPSHQPVQTVGSQLGVLPFSDYKTQAGNQPQANQETASTFPVSITLPMNIVSTGQSSMHSYNRSYVMSNQGGPWNPNPSYESRLPTYTEAMGLQASQGTQRVFTREVPFASFTQNKVVGSDANHLAQGDVSQAQNEAVTSKPGRIHEDSKPKITVPPQNDLIAMLTQKMSKSQVDDTPTLAMTPKGTGEGYGVGMDLSALLKEAAAITGEEGASKPDSAPLSASLIADWMEVAGNMDPKDLEALQQELILSSPMTFC